jgi:hypothetical protein
MVHSKIKLEWRELIFGVPRALLSPPLEMLEIRL